MTIYKHDIVQRESIVYDKEDKYQKHERVIKRYSDRFSTCFIFSQVHINVDNFLTLDFESDKL